MQTQLWEGVVRHLASFVRLAVRRRRTHLAAFYSTFNPSLHCTTASALTMAAKSTASSTVSAIVYNLSFFQSCACVCNADHSSCITPFCRHKPANYTSRETVQEKRERKGKQQDAKPRQTAKCDRESVSAFINRPYKKREGSLSAPRIRRERCPSAWDLKRG